MDKEARYWKCEYENLRRKKKKEIERLRLDILRFLDITWNLLKKLGLKDNEIFIYYQTEQTRLKQKR